MMRSAATLEIPGYELLDEVGRGGRGIVYRARHFPLNRIVALKILFATEHLTAEDRRRMLDEVEVVARLQHAHIAATYEIGLHRELPFFAMEYLAGGNLTQRLRHAPLTPLDAARLVEKLARALESAHYYGVVHGDLKPNNVLLQSDDVSSSNIATDPDAAALVATRPPLDTPKISDFGMARRADVAGGPTESTDFSDSAPYLAPEQVNGPGNQIGPAADIYSLGAILYECLTGRPPFVGPTANDTLKMVRGAEPVSVRRLQPSTPRDLETICLKCLAKEPAKRYRSMTELAEDLRRIQVGKPIRARLRDWPERPLRWMQRRPIEAGLLLGLCLAILMLTGGIVGMTLSLKRALEEQRRAEDAERQIREEKDLFEAAERLAQEDRFHALEDRASAQAVIRFLHKDVLGQGAVRQRVLWGRELERDPNSDELDLLDAAATAVDGRFRDQPLAEAAIHLAIGDGYFALGRYGQARVHLSRALDLRQQKLPQNHADVVECEEHLALVYQAQGEFDRAAPLLEKILTYRERSHGAEDAETLRSKSQLAGLYLDLGQSERAEPFVRQVLSAREKKLGANHPDTLASKFDLARLLHAQSKYDLAEPLYREVLNAFTDRFGDDDPDTLISKNSLASLLADQRHYERAEEMCRDVLSRQVKSLGADHPHTLTTRNHLAHVYAAQEKTDRAVGMYLEVIELEENAIGSEHPKTIASKNDLAAVYIGVAEFAKAEPLLRAVLKVQETRLGPEHPTTLATKSSLTRAEEALGKFGDAEALLIDLHAIAQKKFGADHPDTLSAKSRLAQFYFDRGQYIQAEPLLRAVLQTQSDRSGPAHASTVATRSQLALNYEKMSAWERAEPLLVEQVAILAEQSKGRTPEDLELAASQARLGTVRLRLKKFSDAEKELRASLAIREARRPNDWVTFQTKSLVGEALLGQRNYDGAEKLLLQAYESLKSPAEMFSPQAKEPLAETVRRLIELYTIWDKKDKADEWRKKLPE